MKKRLLILIMVALNVAHAQERPFFDGYYLLSVDFNGHYYTVADNILKQESLSSITQTGEYRNALLGNIACIDAQISSKILIYYAESGNIVILDNSLAQIGNTLNLFEKSIYDVSLAAMGGSNRIVLYDNVNKELTITDLGLNIVSKSQIQFPTDFNPIGMQVTPNQQIALLDSLNGICLFDFFGTYEKFIPLRNVTAIQLNKDSFYYLQDRKIYKYSLPSEKNPLKIEEIDFKLNIHTTDFRIAGNRIITLSSNGVVDINPL